MMIEPKWNDDVHLPTELGVYYMENCDPLGNPIPGLGLLEPGKPFAPTIPTKYFGPIPGAMRRWVMVPLQPTG